MEHKCSTYAFHSLILSIYSWKLHADNHQCDNNHSKEYFHKSRIGSCISMDRALIVNDAFSIDSHWNGFGSSFLKPPKQFPPDRREIEPEIPLKFPSNEEKNNFACSTFQFIVFLHRQLIFNRDKLPYQLSTGIFDPTFFLFTVLWLFYSEMLWKGRHSHVKWLFTVSIQDLYSCSS